MDKESTADFFTVRRVRSWYFHDDLPDFMRVRSFVIYVVDDSMLSSKVLCKHASVEHIPKHRTRIGAGCKIELWIEIYVPGRLTK